MPMVRAAASEYLLTGRRGHLENRGTAVQAWLWPGTVYVLVPAAKQEAAFEFTQETRDGIPLRFKGLVVYRIADPVAAAGQFDFAGGDGTGEISSLLTHVCLGELRHAVSHMTMAECIEGRKTTLSTVVATALKDLLSRAGNGPEAWGVTFEVAQVAQVFIVDPELRTKLEAEIRNEIRLRSEQSDVRTAEALELATLASHRRLQAERLTNEKDRIRQELQRAQAELASEQERVDNETPVRLLKITRELEVLREERELRRLQDELEVIDVERRLRQPRAEQDLRRELLPLEQAPEIVAAASRVLSGANLTVYGEGTELLGHVGPLVDLIARSVNVATGRSPTPATLGDEMPSA